MPEYFRATGLWLLLSFLSFVFALASVACDRGDEELNHGEQPSGATNLAMQIAIGETTESLVGIDVADLLRRPLAKELRSVWLDNALSELSPFSGCGAKFDGVESVLLGYGQGETVAVITTSVPRAELVACAKRAAERHGKPMERRDDGIVPFWRDNDQVSWVAFIGDRAAVTGSHAAEPAWLKRIVARASTQDDPKSPLTNLLTEEAMVNRGATLWMASSKRVQIPSERFGGEGAWVTALHGSLDLTDAGIELRGHATFDTDAVARDLAEKGQALGKAMAAGAKAEISAVGREVHLTLLLPEEIVTARLKALMPSLIEGVAAAKTKRRTRTQPADFEPADFEMPEIPPWSPPPIAELPKAGGSK